VVGGTPVNIIHLFLLLTILFQLNAHRYPTWASLARDYLAIMASSVSSERAFSSAGITISKRRNRLKADIVEALECLKCMFNHGLLFREVVAMGDLEQELEAAPTDCPMDFDEVVAEANEFSWDQLLDDDDDDDINGLPGGSYVDLS
jgi:hypothetical protein